MSGILSEIIELLTGGITGVAEGIGTGFSTLAQNIFLNVATDGTSTLSVFGALVVIFAGVSLALGLIRWVLNFITSLGARNS